MVNYESRLITFFAANDGEALYSQKKNTHTHKNQKPKPKQNRELTVAQIISFLLPNSDLNRRKWIKPIDHSGVT